MMGHVNMSYIADHSFLHYLKSLISSVFVPQQIESCTLTPRFIVVRHRQ